MTSFAPPPVSPLAVFPIRIQQTLPNEPNHGLAPVLNVEVIRNGTAPLPKPQLPAMTQKVQEHKAMLQLQQTVQDFGAMFEAFSPRTEFDGKPLIPPAPPMDGLQAGLAGRPLLKHAYVVVHDTVESAAPESTIKWSKTPVAPMPDNHRNELFGTLKKRRKLQAGREMVVSGVARGKAAVATPVPKPAIKAKPVLENAPPTTRKWSFTPGTPEKNKALIAELGERFKLRAQVQLQAVVPGPSESSV